MRFVLIGADFEENLGLCMVKAGLEEAGHQTRVVAFNDLEHIEIVAKEVLKTNPDAVGLGIQFQHRSLDFLRLAQVLRRNGYRGHITCGGQFPTMAWKEVLQGPWGVSSVVLYEGERTIGELANALQTQQSLAEVAGLALLTDDGVAFRTADRAMCANLDDLPVARRYRLHTRHLGIPFVPISASRGCWGACTFCSISTLYRDAREHGWTRSFRSRSVQPLAEEMAVLAQAAGGNAVFCFHDDNLLLPRPADSLKRLRALRAALDEFGVGTIGIVGKCRPDCVTPELARELAKLGVIRLYVGIENASQAGCGHLNRRTTLTQMGAALEALSAAGIYTCYNLLIFEPETTLEDVKQNLAFMRSHVRHPVNFCRAEAYHATPLHRQLQASGTLQGSYLGWDYRLRDDRSELLFRIFAAAFRERNFASKGVANRHMSLGYCLKLLETFYEDVKGQRALIAGRVREFAREYTVESADLLEEALRFVESVDLGDRERIETETALLALRVSAADRRWHAELDEIHAAMDALVRAAKQPAVLRGARNALGLARKLGLVACLGVWGAGCGGDTDDDGVVCDPAPRDGAVDVADANDAKDLGGEEIFAVDPVSEDAGADIVEEPDVQQADPPPQDAGVDDVSPVDSWSDPVPPDASEARLQFDRFLDTSPKRARRSDDLPLYYPPQVKLAATRQGEQVAVRLLGFSKGMSTRWQSEGALDGEGDRVVWTPASEEDQLRVAVRSKGGVAVVSLRAAELV